MKITSYGLSSEVLGGLVRARSALRDNKGRFVSDSWRSCGYALEDYYFPRRFFTAVYCVPFESVTWLTDGLGNVLNEWFDT